MKKRLLVLGASLAQIPFIKTAKKWDALWAWSIIIHQLRQ